VKLCQLAEQNAGGSVELRKIAQTGQATIGKVREYFVPGSGLEKAGKVEALLLNAEGRYDMNHPLVYSSPLNETENTAIKDMGLARDLRHVAAIIRSSVGARFFHVGIGGFDTHANQEDNFWHAQLLREVSESITAFYNELGQSVTLPGTYTGYRTGPLVDDVLIVVFSEFGRTIRQNNKDPLKAGTDHASSAPQFVIGGKVVGGQYGAYPQLENPSEDNRDDLKMTTDFRDVYGTVLSYWLGVPSADLGPGAGKLLTATPTPDADGKTYTAFTPVPFLPPPPNGPLFFGAV